MPEKDPVDLSDIDSGWELDEEDFELQSLKDTLSKYKVTEVPGIGPHTAKTLCESLSDPCTMASFVDFGLNKLDELPFIGKEKAKVILDKISELSGLSVRDLRKLTK
ncbi:MAG: hypothetical protein GF334_11180 [Candidatus Altiarchaeales archaeon]|nr:hypothetical protein [Candidatus Altiarchaeales archaeon]